MVTGSVSVRRVGRQPLASLPPAKVSRKHLWIALSCLLCGEGPEVDPATLPRFATFTCGRCGGRMLTAPAGPATAGESVNVGYTIPRRASLDLLAGDFN